MNTTCNNCKKTGDYMVLFTKYNTCGKCTKKAHSEFINNCTGEHKTLDGVFNCNHCKKLFTKKDKAVKNGN